MATRRPYILILVPLVLVSCGGSSSKTSTVGSAPIDAAVSKTLAQGSENVAVTGNVNLSGQAVSISGNGSFSGSAGRLQLELNLPLVGTSTVDLVLRGASAWVKTPLLAASLHGKHWLGIDAASGPAKLFGIDLTPLLLADSPTALLTQFEKGSGAVDLGTQSVGGVSTTHYRVDVGHSSVSALQRTEDAWVDGSNLVRRLSYDAPISTGGTNSTPAVLTMTLSGFGTPVTVTPPAAGDVLDASALRK